MVKILRIEKGNLSPDDALEQFLLLKRAQGLAEITLLDYETQVNAFFKNVTAGIESQNA